MALALDASSPVRFNLTHSGTGATSDPFTGTSASFTAPANSLILVCGSCDSATAATQNLTPTTTDSGGLTWNIAVERDPVEGSTPGYDYIAWAAQASSAARTVSISIAGHNKSGTAGAVRGTTKIYVWTGADLTGVGANTGEGSSTTNAITPTAFTSTTASSVLLAVSSEWNALGSPTSSDLTIDAYNLAGSVLSGLTGYKTLGATGSQTINLDAAGTSAAKWNWAAVEIVPASGGATAKLRRNSPLNGLAASGPFFANPLG